MNIEIFRQYCLSLPAVTEDMPFDENTLVFRVGGKIFALTGLDSVPFRVNLKCDPEWAMQLREQHTAIVAGFHMNKKHWNTVTPDGKLSAALFEQLITHSYELVAASLPKKTRESLGL